MAENTPVRIDPLFNDVFLYMFGREESRGITRSLVNAVLRKTDIDELDEVFSIHAGGGK